MHDKFSAQRDDTGVRRRCVAVVAEETIIYIKNNQEWSEHKTGI